MERLTRKQRKFVNAIVEGGTGTDAALAVYDTDNPRVAAAIASENLTKPNIIKSIQEALPDELLAQVHLEGLNATRSFPLGEGEYEDAPDYAVRHKYLDSAYKLKGSYAAEKHVNLNIDAESTERTRELGDRILGLLRRRD